MGNETWRGFWLKFAGAILVAASLQTVAAIWYWGRYTAKMEARMDQGEKRLEQVESFVVKNQSHINRIDSEGSARYARESKEISERLRGIEQLLRESRESQAAILNELKRKQ